jgi:tRNA pseudouridine38-40 synthase
LTAVCPSSDSSRNIRLTVSYDGTNYHGFQSQPHDATIQDALKEAVEHILDHEVKIIGGARTDAGVHAMGQVVNFVTWKQIGTDNLRRGLNSVLPQDIRITEAREAAEAFHARYSAKSKVYVYCILNRPCNSPFLARYTTHVPYPLDTSRMREAIKIIVGEHDFSAFKKKDEFYRNPVREVARARVAAKGDMIYVIMEATGFLRYMVRNITGTLLLVGRGKTSADDFAAILKSREREKAGPTAPPHGLFLREIKY